MFTHLNIIHWHKLFYRNTFFFSHFCMVHHAWRWRVRQNQMENHRKNLPQHFYVSSLNNECYCCYFNEIRCESHKKCKRINKKTSSKVLDGGLVRFILRQRDCGTSWFFVNIFIFVCFCMRACEFRVRIESLNELKVPRAKYMYTYFDDNDFRQRCYRYKTLFF